MNLRLRWIFILIGVVGINNNQYAQTDYKDLLGQDQIRTITTAVPFLMIAPDARAGAMGDAGAATDPDLASQHWNPAKYAMMEPKYGGAISYTPWLKSLVNDINLYYVSGYYKFNERQTLSASLLYFSLGNITFTDAYGGTIGDYNPNEFAIDAAYSLRFSKVLSSAIAARYINSNLTQGLFLNGAQSSAGQSVAADISLYYHKKAELGKNKVKYSGGMNISNIGNKISYTNTDIQKDFIPINMRIGGGFGIELDEYNELNVAMDVNKLLVPSPPIYLDSAGKRPIDMDGDGKYDIDGKDPNRSVANAIFTSWGDAPDGFKEEMRELTYSLGLEYWYAKQFAIRAGYFNEHKTKGNRKYFTFGAGLRYNVMGLDFAYLVPTEQRNPLENTLRFTLSFNFDNPDKK